MIPTSRLSHGMIFLILPILILALLANATNNALNDFKLMVCKRAVAMFEMRERHMAKNILEEKSIETFEPLFAYLVNFYPHHVAWQETEFLIDQFFEFTLYLPPSRLLDPITKEARKRNDQVFINQLAQYQAELQAKIDKSNENENIGPMREFLDEFERDPDSRQMEIQNLFLEYKSLDGCLLDGIKQILLASKILVGGINIFRSHTLRLFSCPEKKNHAFVSGLNCYSMLYTYNYLVRMLDQARRSQGSASNALLQAHNVITYLLGSTLQKQRLDHTLPNEIRRKFRTIAFKSPKEKEYVQWRLAYYNREVREKQLPVEYRFMAELMPLHVLVLTQVLMGIKRFIPVELCNDKEAEPPSVYTEFIQSFFETKVSEATSSKIVTRLFENRVDRLVVRAIENEKKYAMFASLTLEEISRMTASSVVPFQEECDETFVTFRVEKQAKKHKKQIKKKKTKAKRLTQPLPPSSTATLSIAVKQPVEPMTAEVARKASKAEKEREEVDLEEPEKEVLDSEVYLAVDRELVREGKQEEAVSSSMSEEDCNFREETVREEIEEAMRQQKEEIAYYRRLKKEKLDFAKLEKSRIQPIKDDPSIGKPKKVAFLRTEDFRMISEEADQVFLGNTVSEAARAKYGSADRFQWVFDRSVVIDAHAYKFLCQVFGLAQGKAFLTFENFFDAISQINRTGKDRKMLASTVFKFNHVIETATGEVLVPPIGEVHKEHLSSRFNHEQVRKFLMHGGCHPYFFISL